MSTLDRVRAKYKNPSLWTSKSSKSPSAGFEGPHPEVSESCEPPVVVAFDPERTRRAVERIEAERERRRQKVLAILNADPSLRYAWAIHEEGSPDFVIVAVAIRDTGTAELSIERGKFDQGALAALLGELCGAAK
jgi:hypothetical protein